MKPRIVITVEGGIITRVASDVEGQIIILDYDIEGTDEEELVEDALGNKVYLYGGTEMEYDPDWVDNEFKTREKKLK